MSALEAKYVQWRSRYLKSDPATGGFYIYYNATGDAGECACSCSEGHGYGMLISLMKGNQPDFDGLVRYLDAFTNANGLMQWQQDMQGGRVVPAKDGTDSATDGDIDVAAALWGGVRKWGNPEYATRARRMCNGILDRLVHPRLRHLLLGDWVTPDEEKWLKVTRSSDFILDALVLFYEMHAERRNEWASVIEAHISILTQQVALNPGTGLIADFLQFDERQCRWFPVQGKILESEHDGSYSWNACRVPWRIASYYLRTRDSRVLGYLQTVTRFFDTQPTVCAGYALHGSPLEQYTDLAFLAPISFVMWLLGSASLPRIQEAMDRTEDDTKYFGESIALLCMLQAVHGPI